MKIGLDLMGGDHAPQNALDGAILACDVMKGEDLLYCIGNINLIKEKFALEYEKLTNSCRIKFVDAVDVIEMSDTPTKAYSQKPKSSMAIGFRMLKGDEIDVFIGAGNSGAMLVGAVYSVKVIEGIIRPAIASLIPKENGKFEIIIDVGVNPDARHDVLFQFGLMGSIYLKNIFGIENPRVGLLNIGHEKEKGNLVTQAAYSLMEDTDKYNFIGNIEGYDIFGDKADVLVCDGFTGNMIIKTLEGFYHVIKKHGISGEFIDSFNYETYGGTPILGINKPVILGHGVSSPIAFKNMISLGKKIVENNLIPEIKSQILNQNNIQ